MPQARPAESGLAADWDEFGRTKSDAKAWQKFLLKKYAPAGSAGKGKKGVRPETPENSNQQQNLAATRKKGARAAAAGVSAGAEDRLPDFRRQWVQDYLTIKRRLVEAAFPDKLVIAEMRQFADHDGIQGNSELKWGGFLGDDLAQWSGVGPDNQSSPVHTPQRGAGRFRHPAERQPGEPFPRLPVAQLPQPGQTGPLFLRLGRPRLHGLPARLALGHQPLAHQPAAVPTGADGGQHQPQPQPIGLLLPARSSTSRRGPSTIRTWAGIGSCKRPSCLTRGSTSTHPRRPAGQSGPEGTDPARGPAMDDGVAGEIARWVAAGGLLVASSVPAMVDEYGRPREKSALAEVLGVRSDGTLSEAVAGTPLGITIPRGLFSGGWAESTDRRPQFEALAPTSPQAEVLAHYAGGRPAIVLNKYVKGRAVTMGYPFGREAVESERTSIGFQRTYVWFTREPQLLARTAWLRKFFEDLGVGREHEVLRAELERFQGRDAMNPSMATPKRLIAGPGQSLVRPHRRRSAVRARDRAQARKPGHGAAFLPPLPRRAGNAVLGHLDARSPLPRAPPRRTWCSHGTCTAAASTTRTSRRFGTSAATCRWDSARWARCGVRRFPA